MKTVKLINAHAENGQTILSIDGTEISVPADDLAKVLAELPTPPAIRPSLLPKLAACPCYQSTGTASAAAERGTKMDAAFRSILTNSLDNAFTDLTEDEKNAVLWATSTIRTICGDHTVFADKQSTAMQPWHPAITGGEADAICPSLGIIFDLKSGQPRNYWPQQACYAISLMDAYFLPEVTCHLLFCDSQQLVSRTFTYDEAHSLIHGIIASLNHPPSPCDYCSWCANQNTCPALTKLNSEALTLAGSENLDTTYAQIASDPEKLAHFANIASTLESYLKKAKADILDYITAGTKVPGYHLVHRKGSESVSAANVAKFADTFGAENIIAAYGPMNAAKFRKLYSDHSTDPFPEEIIDTSAGSSYIKKSSKN